MAAKKKSGKVDPMVTASRKQKVTNLMKKSMGPVTMDGSKKHPTKKMGSYNVDHAPKKPTRTHKI
jgi:hypothetical protein